MDPGSAIALIHRLRAYCQENSLALFVVGSVAYSGALKSPAAFIQCDDIDCIVVYDKLKQLENCPFFRSPALFGAAGGLLASGRADMFSSKPVIGGIRVSADFISRQYLEGLAEEPFEPHDSFRVKLTDTLEKPDNEYRSFTGASHIFHKEPLCMGDLFLYRLPVRLWKNDEYYTGALYNKFIHNPILLTGISAISAAHRKLLYGYSSHYRRCAAQNSAARLLSAMLYRERFSRDTMDFMAKLQSMASE